MACHCCLLLYYDVIFLCRRFVTTELVSLYDRKSARTLCVGCRRVESTVECKEHTQVVRITVKWMGQTDAFMLGTCTNFQST